MINQVNFGHCDCVCGTNYSVQPSASNHRNALLCSVMQLFAVNGQDLDLLTVWTSCGVRIATFSEVFSW